MSKTTETQETIADIIAEKRLRAAEMEKTLGDQHSFVESLKNDADRLDAALRREQSQSWHHREMEELVLRHEKELVDAKKSSGNAAKLREALARILGIADHVQTRFAIPELANQEISELKQIAEAALDEPQRNCDRFGGDYKMLHTAWFDWTGSPSGLNPDGTVKMTFSEWLLAPVKKGNAKDNETFSHGLTIRDLPQFLSTCSRAVDQEWKKLSPEKRKKIVENIMRRVEEKGVCGRSDTINAKYTPGQFDERAHDHGQSVIDEMRKATGIKDGTAHSVCVTVYIDGYLQFAGADACLGPEVNRRDAKNQAMFILRRMDPEGKMTKGNSK